MCSRHILFFSKEHVKRTEPFLLSLKSTITPCLKADGEKEDPIPTEKMGSLFIYSRSMVSNFVTLNRFKKIVFIFSSFGPLKLGCVLKTFYLFLWRRFCLTQTLQDSGQTTHGGGGEKITFLSIVSTYPPDIWKGERKSCSPLSPFFGGFTARD